MSFLRKFGHLFPTVNVNGGVTKTVTNSAAPVLFHFEKKKLRGLAHSSQHARYGTQAANVSRSDI